MGDTPDDIRAVVAAGGKAIGVLTPQGQAKVGNHYFLIINQPLTHSLTLTTDNIWMPSALFVSCFGRLTYCPVFYYSPDYYSLLKWFHFRIIAGLA